MSCRCDTVEELYGREAEEYASEHLVGEEAAGGELAQGYSCPDTGRRWVLDYPEATERDEGQARLRVETASG